MSTFIKVEQGDSDLLRRNIEQTQANRLAKVERDEQARTGKQAQDERRQSLAQRGLDASGNALGGSRRKEFRRDEPAASIASSRVLLVTWNGTQPILSDRTAAFVDFGGGAHPNSSSTTITAGATVPALGMSGGNSNSYWRYRTVNSKIKGTSDFTYEAWVQLVSSTQSMIILRIESANNYAIELRYLYTDGTLDIAPGTYYVIADPVQGFSAPFSAGSDLFTPVHICMMRKDGVFQWAINGSVGTINAESGLGVSFEGDMTIDFGLFAYGNALPNRLGPLRLDPDRCRYPTNEFTPDPLPFR